MTKTKVQHASFDVSKEEIILISKILDRADQLGLLIQPRDEHMMDLEACHASGCPMEFQRFLDADDFNFTHDFCGIYRHINRKTGKLENMFHPRTAVKQSKAQTVKS